MRAAVILPAALLACSSSDPPPISACADIAGNYTVTSTRQSGDCDTSLDPTGPASYSIAKNGDALTLVIPSVPGECPVTLEQATCHLTYTCDLTDKDGNVLVTAAGDYNITATGFSGSVVQGLRPPAAAKTCSVTFEQTGKKL